jgi:hypothetical protein
MEEEGLNSIHSGRSSGAARDRVEEGKKGVVKGLSVERGWEESCFGDGLGLGGGGTSSRTRHAGIGVAGGHLNLLSYWIYFST